MTTAEPGRPLIVAHRGASALAPEHTIPAYEKAVETGADALELDVHLSADGQVVVIHDATLDRTTDATGPVHERTLQQLKRLDAGAWFGEAFRGQRIQTLTEVLERFRDRVGFGIELKGGSDFYPGIEERVLTLLQIYDVLDRTLVFSFDHLALKKLKELDPAVRTGALVVGRFLDPAAIAPPGMLTAFCPKAELTTEREVAAALKAGLEVYVWVVNDPLEARRFAAWGVRGLVTDRPELLRPSFRDP